MHTYRICTHPAHPTEAVKIGWPWPGLFLGLLWVLLFSACSDLMANHPLVVAERMQKASYENLKAISEHTKEISELQLEALKLRLEAEKKKLEAQRRNQQKQNLRE